MEKKKKKEVKPPIIEVQKQKIFSTKEIFFFIYAFFFFLCICFPLDFWLWLMIHASDNLPIIGALPSGKDLPDSGTFLVSLLIFYW